jgi:hypothetical protein
MKAIAAILVSLLIFSGGVSAQLLQSVIPINCTQNSLPDSFSFLLTATDYHLWAGGPLSYASSMQIIDAGNPWPPRWFTTAPVDVNMRQANETGLPITNAAEQHGEITFANAIFKKYINGSAGMQQAYLMCNHAMELVDTFFKPGREIDGHDFALNDSGEKLYFLSCDTLVDMRGFWGNKSDSLVSIRYERIEIADKKGKTIFRWNPIENFGIEGMYKPYIFEKSVMNNVVNLGWSHGNSLRWDLDGNILYSFKYIGIGKLSRADGHFMWRIDRNNQKPYAESDSLPIFLQHDLNVVKHLNGINTYTVLSNGDSLHPHCTGYQFVITGEGGNARLKIIKSFTATGNIPETGAGNYDVQSNGNYLINYGIYKGDTSGNHILFECRDKTDKLLSQYTVMPYGFCYRVHQINNWRPPRPVVRRKNGTLIAANGENNGTWYKLSGRELKTVTVAGAGSKLAAPEDGYYCLAVPYGIGYAVSVPFKYVK